MFADDVATCAETAVKPQQQLNVIDQFCLSTGMEINLDKTEIIVFEIKTVSVITIESWYFWWTTR